MPVRSSREDRPSHHGSRVYYDADPSIDEWLARAESAGGRVLVGKRMARHLADPGAFRVSWPKRRQLGSDRLLPRVIEIGHRHGMVESTTFGLDDTWSAIKFTHPKPGKAYRNTRGCEF